MKTREELEKQLKMAQNDMTLEQARKNLFEAYITHAKVAGLGYQTYIEEIEYIDKYMENIRPKITEIRAELMKISFESLIDSAGPGRAQNDLIRDMAEDFSRIDEQEKTNRELIDQLIGRVAALESDCKIYRGRIIATINGVKALGCMPNTASVSHLFNMHPLEPEEWVNFVKDKIK